LTDKKESLWAVIMAGGSGTRLWPLSTSKKPKQFLDFSETNFFQKQEKNYKSKSNLLKQTIERLKGLIPSERIIIAGSTNHRKLIKESAKQLPPQNVIFEPEIRNTATTISLASHFIADIDPNAVMIILPSDHYIGDVNLFRRLIEKGTQYAFKDEIVTIGIEPNTPEIGFGYIEKGKKIFSSKTINAHQVKSFKEKPKLKEAKLFLQSKRFLWNGGFFILKVSRALTELELLIPKTYSLTEKACSAFKIGNIARFNKYFKQCAKISFDHAVMEKVENVTVISSYLEWNDLGSWVSFEKVFKNDKNKNTWLVDKNTTIISENSTNLIVGTNKRFVVTSGVKDLIVIESGDGLLICTKSEANKVGIFADKTDKSFSKKIN